MIRAVAVIIIVADTLNMFFELSDDVHELAESVGIKT